MRTQDHGSEPLARGLRGAAAERGEKESVMLVVFADNLTLVADAGNTCTITTDPVAIGGNNRATAVTNVHSIFNAGTNGLSWQMQISMDGQTWVNQGTVLPATTGTGATLSNPATVTGVYARLRISFEASVAGEAAAVLDVHAMIDRA